MAADWNRLIEDARQPRHVSARVYIGRASASASSPQKYLCGPKMETYCIKFSNNTHGDGRALAAEHIAGRCGQLFSAPVGAVKLVQVSTHLTSGVTLVDGSPVPAGVHHATRWLEDYGDKAGIQYVDENRTRLGALEVLYTWLLCTSDHQLIYGLAPPHPAASVDHTEFLPGSAGGWTPQLLRDHADSVTPDPYFAPAALGNRDRHPSIQVLGRIREIDIARVVAGPPESWGVSATDRLALAEYLWTRRQHVLDLWPEATT